jgi:uncharacterized protein DUF4180
VNSDVRGLHAPATIDMNPALKIIIASDCGISIRCPDDVSDAVGASLGRSLILTEGDLGPNFFDLRTGLAGELIQKFVNYRVRVAIIVPMPDAHGERFAELAHEHATHPTVRFVRSVDEAMQWMNT